MVKLLLINAKTEHCNKYAGLTKNEALNHWNRALQMYRNFPKGLIWMRPFQMGSRNEPNKNLKMGNRYRYAYVESLSCYYIE